MSDTAMTSTGASQDGAQMLTELLIKVDKAKPTKEDRAELNRVLREFPAVWRVAGDLAEQANKTMIFEMKAPESMKMSLSTGLSAMAAELTQPGDGELEKLIIRQIVGCWLRLSYVEYTYNHNTVSANMNMRQGEYWERRLSAAQRRYLRAVESLARVRRLQLPAVQVNIAEQQVNQVNVSGMGEHSG